jgi:two-component sensor histidine kinase
LASGQVVAVGAIVVAGFARWAALPVIGADVSFITAVPAVLVAALIGGRLAGLTTLIAGSGLDLWFSIGIGKGAFDQALPRLVIWLCSAIFVMVITLGLRAALSALRSRERDLEAASEQLRLVIHELEHRGRNALAIVQAVSNETARSVKSVGEYQDRLGGKLAALSASYTILTKQSEEPADLLELVRAVLAPFGGQIRIVGGHACLVPPRACVPLALALHELATNATKYGALSVPVGLAVVEWTVGQDGLLDLHWSERGGPIPTASATEGFGSELLRRVFSGIAGGGFAADRRPEGMAFRIQLLTAPTIPHAGPATRFSEPRSTLSDQGSLERGRRSSTFQPQGSVHGSVAGGGGSLSSPR